LGRPILYSNSAYGAEGVNKCKEIMRAEIAMNMRLLGVTKLDQLDESFVDIEGMKMKNVRLNQDFLGEKVYEPREVIKWDKYDELTSEN